MASIAGDAAQFRTGPADDVDGEDESKSELAVIAVGFGRTGTSSLKKALEELGLGPCYHMREVKGQAVELWRRAAEGQAEDGDWDKIFRGYRSACDFPVSTFWKELCLDVYPDAKVILSTRSAEKWYESCNSTIFRAHTGYHRSLGLWVFLNTVSRRFLRMVDSVILRKTFGGDMSKENAIRMFNEHETAVQEAIPADRLLVHTAADGWGPLCRFLGVPEPETDYPHVNDSAQFQSFLRKAELTGYGILAGALATVTLAGAGAYFFLRTRQPSKR